KPDAAGNRKRNGRDARRGRRFRYGRHAQDRRNARSKRNAMTAAQWLPRLMQSAVTLLILSFLVYILIGLMPGDPVDLMIAGNPQMTAADAARLREIYGLDQPLLSRYGHWLLAALGGDLGYSRNY